MSTTPQSGRSAIESIVQELEKIPEPMQLSVLAFIHSLDGSATPENHHSSELLPRTMTLANVDGAFDRYEIYSLSD